MAVDYSGLLAWQPQAAEQLVAAMDKHGGAVDLSDMGVGKTAQALAAVRYFDDPTLVVCPAVSVTGWQRMGERLNTRFSILNYEKLRTGKTPFGRWENPAPDVREKFYRCDVCQQRFTEAQILQKPKCPHHFLGIHCIRVETKPHDYGKFFWHDGIKRLVFDEVHRCGATSGLQADMLVAGKRQRIPTLGLSATAAENPLDMRGLGYVLGLHNYLNFYAWIRKYGCQKTTWGGFQFLVGEERRKEVMAELHREIIPDRGARVRITDLGDSFPKVQIRAELYDLAEGGRIDELYAQMERSLLEIRDGAHSGMAVHAAQQHDREIELLTVPIFEELARDSIAQGKSVALFVNYRKTAEELCRRLKTQCRVDGSQTGERGLRARTACIDAFQRDDERAIVCTIPAAGLSISLQDVRGYFPRVGLTSICHSAKQMRQVFGRLPRAGGKSTSLYRVICCAGTRQEKIHANLSAKLNQIDALNDGDLNVLNLPLQNMSLADLFKVDESND
jgi:hypothetical protein